MKRILIIDDEPDVVSYLSAFLEDEGYEVDVAQSGKDGLRKVAERKPDLITLDITMPEMTGIEILTKLRRTPDQGDIPVIVITGVERFQSLTTYRGVREPEAFISKPIDLANLLGTIRKLLGE